jgi:hypothetical protein
LSRPIAYSMGERFASGGFVALNAAGGAQKRGRDATPDGVVRRLCSRPPCSAKNATVLLRNPRGATTLSVATPDTGWTCRSVGGDQTGNPRQVSAMTRQTAAAPKHGCRSGEKASASSCSKYTLRAEGWKAIFDGRRRQPEFPAWLSQLSAIGALSVLTRWQRAVQLTLRLAKGKPPAKAVREARGPVR